MKAEEEDERQKQHHIILFYKYSDIPDAHAYRDALLRLINGINGSCLAEDNISGRILVGSNNHEGINGTIASLNYNAILAFCVALMGRTQKSKILKKDYGMIWEVVADLFRICIEEFWSVTEEIWSTEGFKSVKEKCNHIFSWEDFKWSSHAVGVGDCAKQSLFPDLNIKVVQEIISTGGRLEKAEVTLDDVHEGYLSPEEWHNAMEKHKFAFGKSNIDDAILIDCRNQKEHSIGRFDGAIDPGTRTFSEFFDWVGKNEDRGSKSTSTENDSLFRNKTVYMYCTGGIRCEKASAFIRKKTDASEVYHLKGGIHRYVEKYGEEGYFGGKNFVFDRRISVQSGNSNKKIVGKCVYCDAPWDTFIPRNVCTVCRELVLICSQCKASFKELHCKDHFHLKSCYFTDLERFSCTELQQQLAELEEHHEKIKKGKANKQRRKTLRKQIEKIQAILSFDSIHKTEHTLSESSKTKCRNCLLNDCNGECWGFHGLKRAEQLIKRQKQSTS